MQTFVEAVPMPRSVMGRWTYLVLVASVVLALTGTAAATPATLTLSGPMANLSFCTPYRYQVRVVSSQSYDHAFVSLSSGVTSGFVKPRHARLVAHQAWTGVFTETFSPIRRETTSTLELGVMALPPHQGYRYLGHKRFPIAFATLPPATPQPPCSPPSYFGS